MFESILLDFSSRSEKDEMKKILNKLKKYYGEIKTIYTWDPQFLFDLNPNNIKKYTGDVQKLYRRCKNVVQLDIEHPDYYTLLEDI
jgi:hypothetical protein